MNNYRSVQQPPKAAFRTTKIIHTALLAGQVMFAIVALSINSKPVYFRIKDPGDIFLIMVPVMALSCIIAGVFLYKRLISGLLDKPDLQSKIAGYQIALIVLSALLEGSSLFAIVAFLLTSNSFYLAVAFFLMLMMFRSRPTAKIADELQLTYEDEIELGIQ